MSNQDKSGKKTGIFFNQDLHPILEKTFQDLGLPLEDAVLSLSSEPKFGDLQCNSVFKLARALKRNPAEIANEIKDGLVANGIEKFGQVSVIGSYVNIALSEQYLAKNVTNLTNGNLSNTDNRPSARNIILDYGGPNVAKPLHVGHMRSAVIGNTLQNILEGQGNKVVSDIHWGDWGAPMGMVIALLEEQQPELPYFNKDFKGPFPSQPPVSVDDLNKLYPEAAARYKAERPTEENPKGGDFWKAASNSTMQLQNDANPGYTALWRHLCDLTKASALSTFDQLNVSFDLLRGESSVQPMLADMIDDFLAKKIATEENGAVIIYVNKPDDTYDVAPLMLKTTAGTYTYAATDMATIKQRQEEFDPERMVYVVDHRQSDHFIALARAAVKAGYIDSEQRIQHVAFGTVNGKDGKPFKTRDGKAMRLEELLETAIKAEADKVVENTSPELIKSIALGAVKFAELSNAPNTSYNFDVDAFLKAEGKTGIYMMYAAARIHSIFDKISQADLSYTKDLTVDAKFLSSSPEARELSKALLTFAETEEQAAQRLDPSILADHLYIISKLISQFLKKERILEEPDSVRKESKIALLKGVYAQMDKCFSLLDIDMPERMPERTKAAIVEDEAEAKGKNGSRGRFTK